MKQVYTFFLVLCCSVFSFGQTKIGGSPEINPDAMFEVASESKGLLLPRVKLESLNAPTPLQKHVAGMTVYNTTVTNELKEGFYYNDGEKWQHLVTSANNATRFFYMPSIVFDTSKDDTDVKVDLFKAYKDQFALTNTNHFVSEGAPASGIPYFESATDLYYYITDYDKEVFTIKSLDENGVLIYDVKAVADDCTIMNIVFVVKN